MVGRKFRRVDAERFPCAGTYPVLHLLVRAHLHTDGLQVVFHLRREFLPVDKQDGLRRRNRQVSVGNGVESHVPPADVQRVGHLVQCIDQDRIRPFFPEEFPDTLHLFPCRNPGRMYIVYVHLGDGHRRPTLGPYLSRIEIHLQGDPFPGQEFFHPPCRSPGKYPAVHSDHRTGRQVFRHPSHPFGLGLYLEFVQLYLGAVQLRLGLEEVPGVGPQSGMVAGNHYRTGRSGKPAHPGAHRKARRGILALMRVGGGNNGRIDARSRHSAAQGAYLFICCHNVCFFSFFIRATPFPGKGGEVSPSRGIKLAIFGHIRWHPPGKPPNFCP